MAHAASSRQSGKAQVRRSHHDGNSGITSATADDGILQCECTWVENRNKMVADYDEHLLQAVYADGSPRNYDDVK
jgi:hypothetical protein